MQIPGFAPLTVQEGDASGTVNVLNGALNLSFPIGPRYQVNEALSYGLELSFSSANRRFVTGNIAPLTPRDFPRGRSPVGWGWTLHFGRIADDLTKGGQQAYQSPDGVWHSLVPSADPALCAPYPSCFITTDSTYMRAVHLPIGPIPSPGDRWILWTPDGIERELNKFIARGAMCGGGTENSVCTAQDDFFGWYTTGIFDPSRDESVTIEYESPSSGKHHCISRVWDTIRGSNNPTMVFTNVANDLLVYPGAVGGVTVGVQVQAADSAAVYTFGNNKPENWVANPGVVCGAHNLPAGAAVNLLDEISIMSGSGTPLMQTFFKHDDISRVITEVDLPGDLARAQYTWECLPYGQVKQACDSPPCIHCEIDDLSINLITEKRVFRGGGTDCLQSDVDCWTYLREKDLNRQPENHPEYYPCTGCTVVVATNPQKVTVTLPATFSTSGNLVRQQRVHWFNSGLSNKLGVCPDPLPENYRNGLERQVDYLRDGAIVQSVLTNYEIEFGDKNARIVSQETRYPRTSCGGDDTFSRREFSDFDGFGHYQVLLETTDEGVPVALSPRQRRTESRYQHLENSADHDITEWFLGRLVKTEVFDGATVLDPLASQSLFDWDSFGRLNHETRRGLGHPDVEVHRVPSARVRESAGRFSVGS